MVNWEIDDTIFLEVRLDEATIDALYVEKVWDSGVRSVSKTTSWYSFFLYFFFWDGSVSRYKVSIGNLFLQDESSTRAIIFYSSRVFFLSLESSAKTHKFTNGIKSYRLSFWTDILIGSIETLLG